MPPVPRPKQLAVILDGRVAGQLTQDRYGRVSTRTTLEDPMTENTAETTARVARRRQ